MSRMVRDIAIDINADFKALLGERAEIMNVGSAPNSADAETLNDGLEKIHRNLQRLAKELGK